MSDDIKADLGQDIQKSWEGGEVTRNGQRLQDYEFKAPWKQVLDDGTTITRTTAWTAPGCHEGCSVFVHADKDGKLIKVEGDPENPFNLGRLCPRCFCVGDVMYHKDRIVHPMKRDRSKRGDADAWEQCTWDEALDLCAAEFKRIAEEYGGNSIHAWRGTGRDMGWQAGRIAYTMGSANEYGTESGISCYLPRISQMVMTCGGQMLADYAQFHVDRFDHPGYEIPNCVICWGCNPTDSNPDFQLGQWLTDVMRRGAKLISVDPRLTWLASRAEIWLDLRPGTDAALALGMVNVLITEDLIDHEFVDKWVYGYEDFKEVVMQWPPSRAAEVCWVDEQKIIDAARLFAEKKPSNCFWGVSVDMCASGVGAAMAIQALWILTGNLDIPGGMVMTTMPFGVFQYQSGGWGIRDLPEEIQQGRTGWKEYPMYRFGFTLSSPDVALEAAEAGKLKGLWIQTSNTLAGPTQEVLRWRKAMDDVEFCAAVDLFMTPTIQYGADVFLPVACWPEKKGVRAWIYDVSAINPGVKPVGEVKSDAEINRLLGQRFGEAGEHYWPWTEEEQIYDEILKPTGFTYQELAEHGAAYPVFEYKKYEKGMLRPDGQPGFNTPTGMLELNSTMFQQFELPSLAHYQEPEWSPITQPEMYKEYPIILMTGARSKVFFHTEHRQIEALRQFDKEPHVQIGRKFARENGIEDGDWVWIENPRNRCKMRATVDDHCASDRALAPHGWWFPERDGSGDNPYGVLDSNINLLLHNAPSVYGFGSDIRCTLCKIYKVKEGEM